MQKRRPNGRREKLEKIGMRLIGAGFLAIAAAVGGCESGGRPLWWYVVPGLIGAVVALIGSRMLE